jgi:hypothetical protein
MDLIHDIVNIQEQTQWANQKNIFLVTPLQ